MRTCRYPDTRFVLRREDHHDEAEYIEGADRKQYYAPFWSFFLVKNLQKTNIRYTWQVILILFFMLTALKARPGTVVKIGNDLLLVVKHEMKRGGRGATNVAMRLKNLIV